MHRQVRAALESVLPAYKKMRHNLNEEEGTVDFTFPEPQVVPVPEVRSDAAAAAAAAEEPGRVIYPPVPPATNKKKAPRKKLRHCGKCLLALNDGPGNWLNGHKHMQPCPNKAASAEEKRVFFSNERKSRRNKGT